MRRAFSPRNDDAAEHKTPPHPEERCGTPRVSKGEAPAPAAILQTAHPRFLRMRRAGGMNRQNYPSNRKPLPVISRRDAQIALKRDPHIFLVAEAAEAGDLVNVAI